MNATANAVTHHSDLHLKAVAEIHVWFVEHGAQVLTDAEVREFGRRTHTNGWRICLGDNLSSQATILTDADFPWTIVSIFADPALYRVIPHIEQDGWVCTLPGQATIDVFNGLGVTKVVLQQAQSILAAPQKEEEHKDEFAREFLSYWNGSVSSPNVRSLNSLSGNPRKATVWRSREFTLVADTKKQLLKWLRHSNGGEKKTQKTTYKTEVGIIIPLDNTPLPSQFPVNAKQVLALAQSNSDDAVNLLKQAVMDRRTSLLVQFIASTPMGPAPFAVELTPLKKLSRGPNSKKVDSLIAGYRPKAMPIQAVANRVFVNRPTVQRTVDRIDQSWVHGRDVVPITNELQQRHVVMIGCGSIGSTVASLIAKSGVGKLTLIDPERVAAANTSRHELGLESIGTHKSKTLRAKLLKQFPHMQDIQCHTDSWQDVFRRHANMFAEADVVVSTIGDWTAEGLLNDDWLRSGRETPLIIGWTEPFAGAGHAVALSSTSGCLACHFEYSGKAKLRVTRWPNGTLKQEPACAAMFQPYGAIELGHVHSLVARAAIDILINNVVDNNSHRIWCAQHSLITQNGGDWTKEWSDLHPNSPNGGFLWEREWLPTKLCPHCGSKV